MRKITAGLAISLDGVVSAPSEWAWRFLDGEMNERIAAGISEADAVLIGRRSYLEFAQIWPGQGSDVPMARFLNETHKYVVSRTLRDLDWGPATLIEGDLLQAVTDLKQRTGKNIQVPASPTLAGWLLRNGLLDELSLMVCPTVVGSGLRLFDGDDRLDFHTSAVAPLTTGAVSVTYTPVQARSAPASFPDAARRVE